MWCSSCRSWLCSLMQTSLLRDPYFEKATQEICFARSYAGMIVSDSIDRFRRGETIWDVGWLVSFGLGTILF